MQNAQLDTTVQKEVMYPPIVHEDLLPTPREIRMSLIANLVVLDITVIQMPLLLGRENVTQALFVSGVSQWYYSSYTWLTDA